MSKGTVPLIIAIVGVSLLIFGGILVTVFGERVGYYDRNGYSLPKTLRFPVEPFFSLGLISLIASPFILLTALSIFVYRKLGSKETKQNTQ